MPQTIISVSREFGSAGHVIAERIAKDHGLNFYDRHILDEIATENNIKVEVLEKYDEKPRNAFLSRRVGAFSNSMEEILGRCAETVLTGHSGLISIFIVGDELAKIKRIMEVYKISESDAIAKIRRHDKKRKQYHNRHSSFRWGDSRYYDMCINSSRLGLEHTGAALEYYITERISQMQ